MQIPLTRDRVFYWKDRTSKRDLWTITMVPIFSASMTTWEEGWMKDGGGLSVVKIVKGTINRGGTNAIVKYGNIWQFIWIAKVHIAINFIAKMINVHIAKYSYCNILIFFATHGKLRLLGQIYGLYLFWSDNSPYCTLFTYSNTHFNNILVLIYLF